jgi:hypothetical protein
MTRPIQRSNPSADCTVAPKSTTSSAQSLFASRIASAGTATTPPASGAQTLSQKVISTALGGKPSALTSTVAALGQSPATAQLAQQMEQVRTFALQNAIFNAGSMPIVERDNSV